MSDIFISYSSKDREKAEQLTELLASAGLSVWIDQSGIEISSSWSKEIVQAINGCKAFVVLLSPDSIISRNVIKEVSLASEKAKKILPIDLEPVTLPEELEYQLAGIQRSPMSNIDAIIRALGKLGLEATKAPELKLVKETAGKKSLMILPFEDLSPTADNGWFADGIVSEMISTLSNVKSLHLSDAQATKEFKNYKGQLTTFAQTMQIRYFVQGSVRKFGDQIKISVQLLDIDTGDYLWQHSLKGVMEGIFDIQEDVAREVLKGLELHLSTAEKQKLSERGTENIEAYELVLKSHEYYERQTYEGLQLTIQLLTEAIRLDPGYANAYKFKAGALAQIYRTYDRNPVLLVEAESLCNEVLRLLPDSLAVNNALCQVYIHQGKLAEAEELAKEFVRKDPENYYSHFALAFFYLENREPGKGIPHMEECIRLKPDYLPALFNLAAACSAAQETEKCRKWALFALPVYERHLKLHPDDEQCHVINALLFFWSGRTEDARKEAMNLKNARDGASLFNTACLFIKMGEVQEAIVTFRKAIEAGFKNIRSLREFLAGEEEGIAAPASMPEYKNLVEMVDQLEMNAKIKNGDRHHLKTND